MYTDGLRRMLDGLTKQTSKRQDIGPNIKRLVARKMGFDAIPAGSPDAFNAGIAFLSQPRHLLDSAREAVGWTKAAILAVRRAAEPNPWKEASDEEIAGELLRLAEKKPQKNEQTDL